MKLYELILDTDDDADSGVFALSLVSAPAIEANWVYFSKEGKQQIKFATIDNDKRTIVAPVLIPDMKILRMDEYSNEEYEVFFTKETVEKLAQKYLQDGYQSKATFEHFKNIDGDVTVVESWVSKSSTKDKSALYFNRAFPVGTWFVTFKVNSETLWQDYIKTGIVKAVSLEGIFDHKLIKASKIDSIMEKDIEDLNETESLLILSKINDLFRYELGDGTNPSVDSSYPGEGPESGSYTSPETLEDVVGNINVFGLETEYFYMCPGAVATFTHLVSMPMDEDTKGMVRSAALQADKVFDIEEDVIENGKASPKDLGEAIVLVADFKDLMKEIDEITGMKHDISYMDGHVQVIKKYI
jgi:hypothetical protein